MTKTSVEQRKNQAIATVVNHLKKQPPQKVKIKDLLTNRFDSQDQAEQLFNEYPILKYFQPLLIGYFATNRILMRIVLFFIIGVILINWGLAGASLIDTAYPFILLFLIYLFSFGLLIMSYDALLKLLTRNSEIDRFRRQIVHITNCFIDMIEEGWITGWHIKYELDTIQIELNYLPSCQDSYLLLDYYSTRFNRPTYNGLEDKNGITFEINYFDEKLYNPNKQREKLEELEYQITHYNELFLNDSPADHSEPATSYEEQLVQTDQNVDEQQGQQETHSQLTPHINYERMEEANQALNRLIGLDEVKETVKQLKNNMLIQIERSQLGQTGQFHNRHLIFTGNPGTGKTTVARIMAKIFNALGLVSRGHLIEVTRKDLVGQYQGHTAQKTHDVLQQAIGGILFIDEAYALYRGNNDDFGSEAVDELVKGMEEKQDDLIVIFAGYQKEMSEFLQSNSGLRSRISAIIDFPDYSTDELVSIAKEKLRSKKFILATGAETRLRDVIENKQIHGRDDIGNGRMVDQLLQQIIDNQADRLIQQPDRDAEALMKILPEDIGSEEKETFNLDKALQAIVGHEHVKEHIRKLAATVKLQEQRKKKGLGTSSGQSLHMVFKGNPGTGKTTVARIIARLLKEIGVSKSGHLVETDRSELVGKYVGHTEKNTQQVIQKALGGILFIDEAYTLTTGSNQDFGNQAIATLLKAMEDYRDDLVVIVAGYSDEMDQFIASNPGLESRFPHVFEFEDYNLEELYAIFEIIANKEDYIISDASQTVIKERLAEDITSNNPSNGRFVRNLFQEAVSNLSYRVFQKQNPTEEDLKTFIPEDFKI